MSTPLRAWVDIRAGHPFRGTVPACAQGEVRVIQMRDLDPDALAPVDWASLVRTELAGARHPDWLRAGDVLFAARGMRNYALCLPEPPTPTVGAQYFFVLRPRTPRLRPDYLAWHINQAFSQRYLAAHAEGTDQLSIRRGVLESMPLVVPSLEHQRRVVELAALAVQERLCHQALIRNRQQELEALAEALLATPGLRV